MRTTFNIFQCFTSLLPGDMHGCLDPTNITDPSCTGGLAAVSSIMRHSQLREEGPALFRPNLDKESKFVQMHPEGWGVNRLIAHDYFGWDSFYATPSLFTDTNRLRTITLMTPDYQPLITNVDLSPTSMWSNFLHQIKIDEVTRTASILIDNESQPNSASAVESLIAALDYIAYVNTINGCFQKVDALFDDTDTSSCVIPIVHFQDQDDELNDSLLEAALAHQHPPAVFSDAYGDYSSPKLVRNHTVLVTLDDGGDILSHLHVEMDLEGWTISNFTFETINVEDLPSEYKDEQYIEDMVYLRSLADDALANDPVVGVSGFMPFTRVEDWRMCMGGECPIGNLFTDALRWDGDADFAVVASGGLRGEGWEAGEVHVSDLWAALPFMNYLCTGTMSGVSVFRLLNYSTSVATFESTYTDMGDRLLQMSGIKMTYNKELDGSGAGRLISVDVFDKEKQEYLPLERLKMYRFATDNWMCEGFDPYPSLLKDLRMEGEVNGVVDRSKPLQDIVGEYLMHLNDKGITYDTSIRGSHTNDTDALQPMQFVQSAASCLNDFFWKIETLTCTPCPGGQHVMFAEEVMSFLITSDTANLSGRNVLSNRELFNVTVAPRQIPRWIRLKDSKLVSKTVLQPGESIAIDFDVDEAELTKGTARSTISYGVVLDGDYPGCLTDLDITFDVIAEVRGEENYNHLGAIRAVGYSLMSLSMLGSIFFSTWTYKNRKERVVQKRQPIFLHFICGGTFIMASAIIPMSIDDSAASERGCDVACMSVPWLFSMGFAMTFSALFAKLWRVHKVLSNAAEFRRVVVKERDAMKWIILIFALNVILLLCWTLIDPLQWTRRYINGDPTNSYGSCKAEGKASLAFTLILILVDGAALVSACLMAYRARKLDDEFTESKWIGVACASWLQVLVIGIPVILLTRTQPVAQYFTSTALIFLVCSSMLLLLFLPKMRLVAKPPQAPRSSLYSVQSTVGHTRYSNAYGRTSSVDMGKENEQFVEGDP